MLSKELITMAQKIGIRFPTPLPLFASPPNRERLAAWANSQTTPMLRQIAHKVADHLNYISFEVFLEQLKVLINDFNQVVQDTPYVLLIAEGRANKLEQGCSDLWVAGLAMEHCGLKPPIEILTTTQLPTYLRKHPNINQLLILDDAAYSGAQKTGALSDMFSTSWSRANLELLTQQCTLWIGIPFLSSYARMSLSENDKHFKEMIFLKHANMPSVKDCLTEEEYEYASRVNIGYTSDSKTLTYFDHRFPDFYSTFQQVYTGSFLIPAETTNLMRFIGYTFDPSQADANRGIRLVAEPSEYNSLAEVFIVPNYGIDFTGYNIPVIISPYTLHRMEDQEKLRAAIECNKIGFRTQYQPQDVTIQSILASTKTIKSIAGYKKPQLPLEQQTGFDKAVIGGDWKQITYQDQERLNKQIIKLYDQIDLLLYYGTTLKTNGLEIVRFANAIKNEATVFFQKNTEELKNDFPEFKRNFIEKLRKQDSVVNTTAKQILANILIVITGVGILLLAGQLVYSAYSTGHGSFFFSDSVNKQPHIDRVDEALNQIQFSA